MTATTTPNTLTRPADLDPSRLYSPAEVAIWRNQVAAYHEAIRAEEDQQRLKEQAAKARDNRTLSEAEYHAAAVKRHEEQKAKEDARKMERIASELAEAAYMQSLPEVAEVSERSEFLLLTKLQNWMHKGFTVADDSVQFWTPGFYSVKLHRPTTNAKKKGA